MTAGLTDDEQQLLLRMESAIRGPCECYHTDLVCKRCVSAGLFVLRVYRAAVRAAA